MITAKRTTDQELVTRNSSSFKKLPNPPEEVIRESSPVPPVELQAALEFDGPETIEHTEMPANQEEFNPVTPSETILVKDNHLFLQQWNNHPIITCPFFSKWKTNQETEVDQGLC